LLGRPRAIVTPTPGTTRDYLEVSTILNGLPVRLLDTAGLRESNDPIEQQGMRLSLEMARASDLTLIILDGEAVADNFCLPLEQGLADELGREKILVVWNKTDLCTPSIDCLWETPILPISAKTGQGLEDLTKAMIRKCAGQEQGQNELVPNLRQTRLLELTLTELSELRGEIAAQIPPDICSLRLEAAISHLEDITGLNTSEQILNEIFANFCIGK